MITQDFEKELPELPSADVLVGRGYGIFEDFFTTQLANKDETTRCVTDISPYWSKKRDNQLRSLATHNEFLTGLLHNIQLLLNNINYEIIPADKNNNSHNELSKLYNMLLQMSLSSELEMFISDILITDNGGFIYIDGPAPSHSPLTTMPTGLRHLDSLYCTRTRNRTYPVVYTSPDNGAEYALHASRVIFFAQNPNPDFRLNKVGYSSVSKLLLVGQHLLDVALYDYENLNPSDSNASTIWGVYGSDARSFMRALEDAQVSGANAGRRVTSNDAVIAFRNPSAKLERFGRRMAPEGYNKKDDVDTTISLAAMLLGIQPSLLFDSSGSSTSRANSRTSQKIAESKLIAWFIKKFQSELVLKFLPQTLRLVRQGEQEDVDGTKSRILLNRSLAGKNNLANGITTDRIERQKLLSNGDINESQYLSLELSEERRGNGLHISTLFCLADEPKYARYLSFDGIDNPLDIAGNDTEQMIEMINERLKVAVIMFEKSTSMNITKTLNEIIHALQWLEDQYQVGEEDIDVLNNSKPVELVEQDFNTNNANRSMPRQEDALANENNVQEKEDVDIFYELITGEMDFDGDLDQYFTKVSLRDFRAKVRKQVRNFWSGSVNKDTFRDSFRETIEEDLADTFKKQNPESETLLRREIGDLKRYVTGFSNYIERNAKAAGGKLKSVLRRADLWAVKNDAVKEVAKISQVQPDDELYQWQLGITEHCSTCLEYEDEIKTRKEWLDLAKNQRIYPRSSALECKGIHCKCNFVKV